MVVKNVVSSSKYAIDFFGNLETLYSFIWCSKKRVAMFREHQEKWVNDRKDNKIMALKRVCTTRWSSHYSALETVLNRFDSTVATLEVIYKTEGPSNAKVGATASGLLEYFKFYRFLYTAHIYQKIFHTLEPLNKILQTKDLDLLAATTLIENAKKKIAELNNRENNSFIKIKLDAEEFDKNCHIEFVPLSRPRQRKVPKILFEELCQDEPIIDPIKKLKVECFYTALDKIQTELNERFGMDGNGLLKDISLVSKKKDSRNKK